MGDFLQRSYLSNTISFSARNIPYLQLSRSRLYFDFFWAVICHICKVPTRPHLPRHEDCSVLNGISLGVESIPWMSRNDINFTSGPYNQPRYISFQGHHDQEENLLTDVLNRIMLAGRVEHEAALIKHAFQGKPVAQGDDIVNADASQ